MIPSGKMKKVLVSKLADRVVSGLEGSLRDKCCSWWYKEWLCRKEGWDVEGVGSPRGEGIYGNTYMEYMYTYSWFTSLMYIIIYDIHLQCLCKAIIPQLKNIHRSIDICVSIIHIEQISYLLQIQVAHSCPTFCNPVDCSPSGFSIHGIFQARIREWAAISFSRRSP